MRPDKDYFEAILNATAESIFLVDTRGFVLTVNDTAAQRLGRTREEMTGKYVFDFFPPDAAQVRQRNLQQVVLSGDSMQTHDTRGDRHFSLTYYPVKDEHGQVDAVAVYAADVSARKLAEQALVRSEELSRSVLTHAAYSIIATDAAGIITVFNPGAERLHGYRAAEVIGSHTPTLFHLNSELVAQAERLSADLGVDIAPGFDVLVARSRIAGAADESEYTYVRKDGGQVSVLLSVTARTDANGLPLGYLGIAQDITERKRTESDLRVAAIAFESQEGMLVTDAQRRILRVNRAFSDITGYTPEEVIGKKPNLLKSGRHDAAFYQAMDDSLLSAGVWQGEIVNRRKAGDHYPEWLTITAVRDQHNAVTNYVATLVDISSRKAAELEINNLAFYDTLTGLPNRRLLLDRLRHALATSARSERHGALLFIDLDNFKTLNDTLGHDIGDLLLQQVALRLSHCIREGDTVARFGGDEFVVMLEQLSESLQDAATQTEAIGEKILLALNQPYDLAGHLHASTPSIGVTLFIDHELSIDELMKRADLAMYQSKAAGRNTLRFFDPEMQAAVTTRAALESDLREALLKRQFVLYYQAQVDSTRQLTGVEALLRWEHPKRGLVSPLEFIPLAEETGVILPLGQWVLETACAQLQLWARRPEMAHLTIAVNVSARQLHHPQFVDQVLSALARSGANPARLKLELTESLLVTDVEGVISKMTALKSHGLGFSLDDFGTGYSSLSYLKRLPLDQLKIDQGFVRNILVDANDAAISKMVVALAESLGLSVIAEGVEEEAQSRFLALQGCHAYQGFLYSRPLPLGEFESFVARA